MEDSSGIEEEVENDRVSGSTTCVCVCVGGGGGGGSITVNQEFYSYHILLNVISNLVGSYCCETTFCQGYGYLFMWDDYSCLGA